MVGTDAQYQFSSAAGGPPVFGFITSRVIMVADEVGIFRELAAGPLLPSELATRLELHARTTARWLRALTALNVLSEDEDGRVLLGPLAPRRALSPIEGFEAYLMWTEAEHTLRTGAPAFDAVFANSFYEYLARNPETDRRWGEWNEESAASQLAPLIDLCHLPEEGLLVDVGGGRGVFLSQILRARPRLRAVLLDSSAAVIDARRILREAGVDDRATFTAGSFFDALPSGGDVYLLSRVVYNLDDEDAVALLRRCRAAMRPDARVLIVESIMPPPDHPRRRNAAMGDLQMLLLLGAATRELGEHEALLAAADLRVADVRSPDGYWAVIEAVPAAAG